MTRLLYRIPSKLTIRGKAKCLPHKCEGFSLGLQSPYKADRTSTLKWEAEASSSTYKLQVHSKRETPFQAVHIHSWHVLWFHSCFVVSMHMHVCTSNMHTHTDTYMVKAVTISVYIGGNHKALNTCWDQMTVVVSTTSTLWPFRSLHWFCSCYHCTGKYLCPVADISFIINSVA